MSRKLVIGQPAPWFHAQALDGLKRYAFDTVAGRWVLMLFAGSAGADGSRAALDLIQQHRDLFDDQRAAFFGVTTDPDDVAAGRIAQKIPGIRWFLDYDRSISASYGAFSGDDGGEDYAPFWLVLDPMLRLHMQAPLAAGAEVLTQLRRLAERPRAVPAPVLIVPDVLPRHLCQYLIDQHEKNGGSESGFMREVGGVTRQMIDRNHKQRLDYEIEDQRLVATLRDHLFHGLRPMIKRAFQFDPTRVERWLVACYDAEAGGHFRPHRDNTTKGTAHRKFAVTINLDTSRYDGGDLCFPEFGPQTYRAPTGGAVVFSCSLLHEARPVTKGQRYAFLPFLYDDEGARLREHNLAFVAPELQNYRSGLSAD